MSSSSAPRRISLALTLHNHQPVGNFGWVFDEIYEKAYLPMIEALERHPKVRLSLHYTGPLLEWFAAAHPEFLARVRALVERGQVEIVGGGLYEPILASLPAANDLHLTALNEGTNAREELWMRGGEPLQEWSRVVQ